MPDPDLGSSLREKAAERTEHLGTVFLDSLFLVFWAFINFGADYFVERLHLAGIDEVVLRCVQVLFGVATLAPICVWLYTDIRIMVKRANRKIQSIDEAMASAEAERPVGQQGSGK